MDVTGLIDKVKVNLIYCGIKLKTVIVNKLIDCQKLGEDKSNAFLPN